MTIPRAHHKRRVLFVEDDGALAEMYKLKLELDGHRVRIARDGESGLSMAGQFKPDVILLDIAVPGMDGLALLDRLRADEELQDVPVLILTTMMIRKHKGEPWSSEPVSSCPEQDRPR